MNAAKLNIVEKNDPTEMRILEGDRCGQPHALSAMCLQSIAKVSTGAKRGGEQIFDDKDSL